MIKVPTTYILIFFAGLFLLFFGFGKWRESFRLEDKTAISIFNTLSIKELPQPHNKTNKVSWINTKEYRAFNPSIVLLNGKMLYSYRISNYIGCPVSSNKATLSVFKNSPDSTVKSYIVLSTDDPREILYLDVPDFAHEKCAYGFEDPRLIVSVNSKYLYIIANSRSNSSCFSEMYMIKIPVSTIEDIFKKGYTDPRLLGPTVLSIKKDQILKLREIGNDIPKQSEKNWMPFLDEDSLMFVYSVNPHIILKCDLETGYCTRVAKTFNPKVNDEMRGSSQARRYIDPKTNRPKYLAVTHRRYSSVSYVSQIYSFSGTYPYSIEEVSPTFVIHDKDEYAPSLIQFVSGLEIKDDMVYITYGEDDCDSKIVITSLKNILGSLNPV